MFRCAKHALYKTLVVRKQRAEAQSRSKSSKSDSHANLIFAPPVSLESASSLYPAATEMIGMVLVKEQHFPGHSHTKHDDTLAQMLGGGRR